MVTALVAILPPSLTNKALNVTRQDYTSSTRSAYTSNDAGAEGMLIERHAHTSGEMAQRAVEVRRTGEVDQRARILRVWNDDNVQPPVLRRNTAGQKIYRVEVQVDDRLDEIE